MKIESTTPSLTWVHFGDLHITDEGEENHRDFLSLIDQINTHLAGHVDFCVLPGDNANNGTVPQYQLIRGALDKLRCPIHIIPGDHDFEPGNLDAFYSVLGAEPLPKAISIAGFRCLFLDVVSAGDGGPDFSLSSADFQWIEVMLGETAARAERPILFMHTYPADFASGARRLLNLIRDHRVLAVDTGTPITTS
jgi:pimeloyl-ACP methyl ester carboxylesterase